MKRRKKIRKLKKTIRSQEQALMFLYKKYKAVVSALEAKENGA